MTDRDDNGDDGDKGGADDDDDHQLWRQATKGIKPLPPHAQAKPFRPRLPLMRRSRPHHEDTPAAPRLPPAREKSGPAGIDRRTDDRLRRGEMAIEARLDLHGLTQDRAHAALQDFIRRSYAGGRRCILVITGKGGPATQGGDNGASWYEPRPGVLREQVPGWLRDSDLAPLILRFYPAQPQHGGAGALYVLLRRQR